MTTSHASPTDAGVLFQAIKVGDLALPNRIAMAPLTRNRASAGNVPTDLNATYYAQRQRAGLILAEADGTRGQSRLSSMSLKRNFKQTVVERVRREPVFARTLLDEAGSLFLNGGQVSFGSECTSEWVESR